RSAPRPAPAARAWGWPSRANSPSPTAACWTSPRPARRAPLSSCACRPRRWKPPRRRWRARRRAEFLGATLNTPIGPSLPVGGSEAAGDPATQPRCLLRLGLFSDKRCGSWVLGSAACLRTPPPENDEQEISSVRQHHAFAARVGAGVEAAVPDAHAV